MTVPAFVSVAERALQRFIDQTIAEFRRLELARFLDGVAVDVPPLAAPGAIIVTHRLGRVPRGFFVEALTRAAGTTSHIALYRRTGERWDGSAVTLYSTGDFVALRLWVF